MHSLNNLAYIDPGTFSSETVYCKPDRQIFEAAIRALKEPPPKILLVGDSLSNDVEAGMRAGLTAVLIDRTGRNPSANHVPRVSTLQELLAITPMHAV